jgi:transcriptional regulator with XRE-family HTH domain
MPPNRRRQLYSVCSLTPCFSLPRPPMTSQASDLSLKFRGSRDAPLQSRHASPSRQAPSKQNARLVAVRKAAGLSQAELAKLVRVSPKLTALGKPRRSPRVQTSCHSSPKQSGSASRISSAISPSKQQRIFEQAVALPCRQQDLVARFVATRTSIEQQRKEKPADSVLRAELCTASRLTERSSRRRPERSQNGTPELHRWARACSTSLRAAAAQRAVSLSIVSVTGNARGGPRWAPRSQAGLNSHRLGRSH